MIQIKHDTRSGWLRRVGHVVCMVALVCAVVSCMDEEEFDTAPSDRLAFSVDTLRLDTVLSGRSTKTYSFAVYNRNGHGISIRDVSFGASGSAGFRVNVDGIFVNNGLAETIDCCDGDSLRVFVELTPREQDQDDPVAVEAELVFTLANGTRQSVILAATSQDVVRFATTQITGDLTLDARRPYLMPDSVVIEEGATLILPPGAVLLFPHDGYLRVRGRLMAEGTLERPVTLRGDRTDLMFENQPYDRVSNQWSGVIFERGSLGNRLNWCDIHAAYDGVVVYGDVAQGEALRMENSIVHNMAGDCFRVVGARAFVGNTQLSNAGGNCVTLHGGATEFIHCTLAQFYPFGTRRGAALSFCNVLYNEPLPLVQADFRNCVITGYADDEVFGNRYAADDGVAFNYGFYNCLLNTPQITDESTIMDNVWETRKMDVKREGNFPKFNHAHLLYSFILVPESPACGIADPATTRAYYPTDRLGRDRFADGSPDAGCYEAQPQPSGAPTTIRAIRASR